MTDFCQLGERVHAIRVLDNGNAVMAPKMPVKSTDPVVTTTLYDPFLSGGDLDGTWSRPHGPAIPDRLCEVIGSDVPAYLDALAPQFAAPENGWRLLQLAIPGFSTTTWAPEPKRELIAVLVPSILRLSRVTYVFLLPDQTVAVLIYEPEPKNLVQLVYKLAALLVDDAAAPQTRVTLTDLTKQPDRLHALAHEQLAFLARKQSQKRDAEKHKVDVDTQFKLVEGHEALRAKRERPLVLVVEDDPSTNALLTTLLGRTVEAHAAMDAVSAVEAYRRLVPDMVFLDIGLPDMDGLHLLERIMDGDPRACVVMLTANAYRQNIETAMKAGAKGFLAKPFTQEKLLNALTLMQNER